MTEEHKKDKYIICSGCKSKYINDEEHISKNFGYTRLEERYKTCVKCKARNKIRNKKYYETNKETYKKYYEEHKEQYKEYDKKYREEHKEYLKEYLKEYNKIKINCPNCNSEVCKKYLTAHQRRDICKTNQMLMNYQESKLKMLSTMD